jgi:hypothetical protein
MDHFAGLGVSVKETSVCILDDAGRSVRIPIHQWLTVTNIPKPARRFLNQVTNGSQWTF